MGWRRGLEGWVDCGGVEEDDGSGAGVAECRRGRFRGGGGLSGGAVSVGSRLSCAAGGLGIVAWGLGLGGMGDGRVDS